MFGFVLFDTAIDNALSDQPHGITHWPENGHRQQRAKDNRFDRIARQPTNRHRSGKGDE